MFLYTTTKEVGAHKIDIKQGLPLNYFLWLSAYSKHNKLKTPIPVLDDGILVVYVLEALTDSCLLNIVLYLIVLLVLIVI